MNTSTEIVAVKESRVGLLLTIWLASVSWLVTFYYCTRAMIASLTAKPARPAVDKVLRQWSQALVRLINLNVKVVGEFKVEPGRPCIVMCSHSSAYDIPVSFVAVPGSLRMLAKKELFKIPIFGRAMRMSEFISIDRQDKDQARKDLELARQKMESGITIWIAPEGTRSQDGELLPFKKGGMHLAIQTNAQIVPVVIKDIHRVLPAKRFRFNLNQSIEVRIGDAIDASDYGVEQRNQLSKTVRGAMEQLLAPPME